MTPNLQVEAYLETLPDERRAVMGEVRRLVVDNLPDGYEETLTSGLITWVVPLSVYPTTYNGHALWYVALGALKSGYSLYLMGVYGSPALLARLEDGYRAAGKRLDMGKSCVHFKRVDDLAKDVVGELIAAVPMPAFIASAESARRR